MYNDYQSCRHPKSGHNTGGYTFSYWRLDGVGKRDYGNCRVAKRLFSLQYTMKKQFSLLHCCFAMKIIWEWVVGKLGSRAGLPPDSQGFPLLGWGKLENNVGVYIPSMKNNKEATGENWLGFLLAFCQIFIKLNTQFHLAPELPFKSF